MVESRGLWFSSYQQNVSSREKKQTNLLSHHPIKRTICAASSNQSYGYFGVIQSKVGEPGHLVKDTVSSAPSTQTHCQISIIQRNGEFNISLREVLVQQQPDCSANQIVPEKCVTSGRPHVNWSTEKRGQRGDRMFTKLLLNFKSKRTKIEVATFPP